jgi:hypothetical protein
MDTISTILSITTIMVIIVGIVGNVISFIVFSRPTFRKSSISIYYRALAFSDSLIVNNGFVHFYMLFYNYLISLYSDAICKLFSYMMFTLGSLPGWILIAVSVDKVLSLKKVNSTGTKRPFLHYMVLTGVVLFNLLLYIEIPIYQRIVNVEMFGMSNPVCDVSTLSFGNTINVIFIVQGNVLPFVILSVSSLITIKLLRDSRRQVRMTGAVANSRKSRDNKFATTSLTFNVLFIVLRMPFFVTSTIGYSTLNGYVLYISNLLFVANYSINFLVHYVSNSLFRRELAILFRVRKPAALSTAGQNNMNQSSNAIKY